MSVELNAHEARVLGVLIEKAFTTPDQYPLTLNAIANGCNQKSNRSPVVDFSEAEVVVALQGLLMKHLAGSSSPAGSRVEKWRHNGREVLKVQEQDLAVVAELLMRGPQAKGELRQRAGRMRSIASLDELGTILGRLIEVGHVRRLPPGSGSRAERFGQTLAPTIHIEESGPEPSPAAPPQAQRQTPSSPPQVSSEEGRVTALEGRVAWLTEQLSSLAERLGEPLEAPPEL